MQFCPLILSGSKVTDRVTDSYLISLIRLCKHLINGHNPVIDIESRYTSIVNGNDETHVNQGHK